jgi:molybdate transport system substrate-binding protein
LFEHVTRPTFAALAAGALAGLLAAVWPSPARAADVAALAPVSFRVLFPDLLAQFEKSSGHKVTVGYAPLGVITERVIKGEANDVAIVSPAQNEQLQKQGKLLTESPVEIARVGFIVFVKKGAPKPDIGSVDALKRTLLAANSIALGDPARGGGAGIYAVGLMTRLGISEDIKSRTTLMPSGTEIAEAVAKGQTEIGIGVASDGAIVSGLDSIPLPAELQNYSLYVAGINSGSMQVDAAKALIAFLTSPAVKQAFKASGFETY